MKLKSTTFLVLALLVFHTLALSVLAGTPPPPLADPTGMSKCRFISLQTPGAGGDSALRINFTSLHQVNPPYTAAVTIAFSAFEGQSVWVGPPAQYVESSANPTPFMASKTQCEPHYRDWTTVGLLHITGAHIVPSSIYHVENVSIACDGIEDSAACQPGGANVSTQLEIRTTRYADVEIPFTPPATTRQPDMGDLGALVKKFRGVPGALIKVRALQGESNAYGEISTSLATDMGFAPFAHCVDSFLGRAYPFKMGKCAGAPTPPSSGACSTDAECTGSNGAGPCLVYCPGN